MPRKNIERMEKNLHPDPLDIVRVKSMGAVTEVRFMARPNKCNIQKVNKESYIELSTGELKSFHHTESRADNKNSVAQSLARLRELLNKNVADPRHSLWITLTYRENMTDWNRLYDDFRKFNMRLQHYIKASGMPHYEYIVAIEPQKRGALHAHLILIFSQKAPFIPNEELAKIWGYGYTKTKSLKNVDNVGQYLSGYLTDMELFDAMGQGPVKGELKEVSVQDENGKSVTKAVVKGARLSLYPPGFRIWRASRGIQKPTVTECTEAESMQEIGDTPLTFERTIKVMDDNGQGFNVINYRQFNKARKSIQPDSN